MAPSIAVMGPLKGSREAIVAGPMLEAVLASVRGIGGAYGVIELDDGRDPVRARELVGRCLADEDIIGVVGPKNSGCAIAVRDLAIDAGLCMVLPAVTAVDALVAGGSLLRVCASDDDTSRAAGRLAASLGLEALRTEADGSAYGERLAAAVAKAATAAGVPTTDDPGSADACFLAMGELEQAERMQTLRNQGYRGLFIGAEGGPGGPLGRLAGEAGEGSWQLFPGSAVPGYDQVYAAECAAAATALIAGFEATGDRAAIASWLRRRDRPVVATPLGPLWFNHRGDRDGAAVSVWRVEGGEMVRAPEPDPG